MKTQLRQRCDLKTEALEAWLYQTPNFNKIGLAEILQIDFKVDLMFYA